MNARQSLRHVTFGFALLVTAVGTLLSGCRRGADEQVVLYVSADEYVARELVRDFEARSGIRVIMLGDTEAKKTTGLVERLRAEADEPQADVFWSSECFMTIALADEALLAPYSSEVTESWPDEHRDEDGRWFAFAGRARVIVYAPGRVDADALPRTWMDLTDARWKDRIVMADPRFGTTGGHLGAMLSYWRQRGLGDAYFEAFVDGLADNNARLLSGGNAGVVDAVARGEADIGMTDTDDVWAARANGLGVELIYPRHHRDDAVAGGGTLVIPNTVARVANGPNPDHAGRLIDYLLSPRAERLLLESTSHNIPLNPAVEVPDTYRVDDPMRVDLRASAAARRSAVDRAMDALSGARRTPDDE